MSKGYPNRKALLDYGGDLNIFCLPMEKAGNYITTNQTELKRIEDGFLRMSCNNPLYTLRTHPFPKGVIYPLSPNSS